ncbi:uncharacterized protein G2W53_018219 [Senna tora]|uniref:Uncharacterized protein n=1 Tax=Senna tora TaxID=362788 RepID=A0A834TRG4_9FABA|nr:uncharacterized protein G2W53_018219 [Senna tora]
MLLRRQEEQRKRTQKAFKFLYKDKVEMAEVELCTIEETPLLCLKEPRTASLTGVPSAKLVIQKAEFMVLKELELSWSQPELIWNLWIEENLTL